MGRVISWPSYRQLCLAPLTWLCRRPTFRRRGLTSLIGRLILVVAVTTTLCSLLYLNTTHTELNPAIQKPIAQMYSNSLGSSNNQDKSRIDSKMGVSLPQERETHIGAVMKARVNNTLLRFVPEVRVQQVNCKKIIDGDTQEIKLAESYQENHLVNDTSDRNFADMTEDCAMFRQKRRYTTEPLSREEEEFPLAFSMLIFKDVAQTERLLRAIYRPQNYYCIHVDKKSSQDVKTSMKGISDCFSNVFLADTEFDVRRGTISVLSPELLCMAMLSDVSARWRYFINLTGQEFPLKTNLDLVRILKSYNGANDISGTTRAVIPHRVRFVHENGWPISKLKAAPPHGLRLTKGSVHIAASRQFVEFILHNQTSFDFLKWVIDTGTPDETFFSTLNYNPQLGIPGAYKGDPDDVDDDRRPFMTRFKMWPHDEKKWACHGTHNHLICIFGVGDLPLLASRPEMFANKFHQDFHPLAYDCLEELHYNRTREEILGQRTFDSSLYANSDIATNHV